MGKKYQNPPVVEALCEIFFVNSQWDGALPGIFFERIKDTYPKRKELENIGVEVNFSQDVPDSTFKRGEKRIQFIKEDQSQLIQIEKDLLVVNQLRPYPRFEDWKPAIDRAICDYGDLAKPQGMRQLGIRYINRIVIPQSRFSMEDYFYLYPQIPENLGKVHGKFMMRLEIPSKHPGHLLVVTFGTAPANPSEISLLLDLYNIVNFSQTLDIKDAERYIQEAHENIEVAFENAITQKTRDLFQEEMNT